MFKTIILAFVFIILLFSFVTCETFYDKGKEFSLDESEVVTPFKNRMFENNKTCRDCHTLIYDEFEKSMHYKATVFRDEIHKAVWEDHPNFKNKKQYKCAQCHLPSADNIESFMEGDAQAFPDINNQSQNEAVSCASCHRIKSIEKHRLANRNLYNDKLTTYYGISTGTSPAHQTKDDVKLYSNGKVCLGCHSHRENIKDYVVCITDEYKTKSFKTCVTCHMPVLPGSGTSSKMDTKHFFHGFAGAHNNQEMLKKYVEYKAVKISPSEIELHIINQASHDLFLHPLRKSIIKIALLRNGKVVHKFKSIEMERILKDEKGIAGCTNATREVKNTLIKGEEDRIISLNFPLKANDKLQVEYGYYLVKEPFVKILNLENNQEAFTYKIFKKEEVAIK